LAVDKAADQALSALLEHVQTGRAFDDVGRFQPEIAALTLWARARFIRTNIDIDDLVQEAVVQALVRMQPFGVRSKEALRAYLRLAISSRVIDELRRTHGRTSGGDALLETGDSTTWEGIADAFDPLAWDSTPLPSARAPMPSKRSASRMRPRIWLRSDGLTRVNVVAATVLALSMASFVTGLVEFYGSYFGAGLTFGGALLAYEAAYVLFRNEPDSDR
jgi:DNA-directed RNA polymerase specialized sigma24 family protein